MDGETVKDVVFKGFGGGSHNAVIRAGFPGVGEEFMEDGSFNWRVRGENGDVLAGGF